MAEDLIFAIEGVGNGNRDSREDSDDDDEQYLICSITDYDDVNKSSKICNHNFMKNKFCETSSSPGKSTFNVKAAWKHAFEKAKHIPDPWAEFHLEEIETESATRYRYNAISGKWVEDKVFVKMAKQPFGRGAMRECYRTKKLSNFTRHQQWNSASNYVAKCYLDSVDREVYFEDVRLQMEAKLWGEEYNRHKPPKQVDIMQMCILEMKDRPGKPLYHLEHYIEGKYIKYNSNSGFVRDENFRLTPQAFSHFTFERSAHQLIVVDIQGVGDLYTDPQIHTFGGTDFGDGNLAKTVLRGTEEVCGSTRVRTISGSRPPILSRLSETSADENLSDSTFDSLPSSPSSWWSPKEDLLGRSPMGWTVLNQVDNLGDEHSDSLAERRMSENGGDSGCPSERRSDLEGEFADRMNANIRRYCESDEDSIRRDHHNEDKWNLYHTSRAHMHRPSCVAVEVERLNAIKQEKKIGKSILGKVHLAMMSLWRTQDWKEALYWYSAALNMTDYDEGGEYDGTGDEPKYCLLARKAEIHMTGGFGVEPDPQKAGDLFTEAADAAMADMKGRLANQYYERADEAWSMMEE
ncbi:hypothetical protein chiPu_0006502 [Chiloscyllium punctatum]|uniref:Alpha-type protein kinase domain-containing protein n=1 Tax=Chiloscyllium punctatum TaxID=137246 RepID=A0A401SCE0_CHIPU|nr:hypothetical protein [Chiloscyllium punctatum]